MTTQTATVKTGNQPITLHYTNEMSRKEWLAFRKNGIGGSDIGTILGLNPYKCATQLFYEKIGLYDRGDYQNIAMFMGTYMEDMIADLWQYWETDQETMIEHYQNKNRIRKCHRINAYIVNENLPHLFASIDRKINDANGILECKTINGFTAQKWKSGIPPMYVAQIQQYLLVTEYDFAEMAVLTDGRYLNVYEFEPDAKFQAKIIKESANFWYKVEQGKYMVKQMDLTDDEDKIAYLEAEIKTLEPPADGSKAYEEFIRDKYKTVEGVRDGTEEELNILKTYNAAKAKTALVKSDEQLARNKVVKMMADWNELNFGEQGKVTFRTNVKGQRQLYVKIKE